ncbi:hypothetical protein TRFO_21212 [Tritrichomonas foetus]|uniref:Protein kinase domain-containing protein n=1 Tax=Tritrichomonas foetus TaxID=1144522 RepID=A0A1J4KKA4_9EUKA|nr:hypothetical protein TRFO_21212 [Tritrichomonas foetus]|eukprot:OHT09781.1 hypothetical protein TRFO_21212 [Tritrichomonas foetus]
MFNKSFSQAALNMADFTFIKTLGYGSHGESRCYCDKESTEDKYVLKQINTCSETDLQIQHFKFQINFPSLLRYNGVYKIATTNESSDYIISTKYFPNGSLEKQITEKSLNNTDKSIAIFGIAAALNFLHSNGLFHGHLFPSNILFDNNNEPRVCDFSLYQLNPYDVSMVVILNKTLYLAPEHVFESKIDTKTDVFSYAMIVYCILTNTLFETTPEQQFILLKEQFLGKRPALHSKSKSDIKLTQNSSSTSNYNSNLDYDSISNFCINSNLDFEIPEFYQNMLTKCWHSDPEKRPTFSEILTEFTTKNDFILNGSDLSKVQIYQNKLYPNGFQSAFLRQNNNNLSKFMLLPPIFSDGIKRNFYKDIQGKTTSVSSFSTHKSTLETEIENTYKRNILRKANKTQNEHSKAISLNNDNNNNLNNENNEGNEKAFSPIYFDFQLPKPTKTPHKISTSYSSSAINQMSSFISVVMNTSAESDKNSNNTPPSSPKSTNSNSTLINSHSSSANTHENNNSIINQNKNNNKNSRQNNNSQINTSHINYHNNHRHNNSMNYLSPSVIKRNQSVSALSNLTNSGSNDEIDLKVSADCGNIESQYKYGISLLEGPNANEGAKYIKLAADSGHLGAQRHYAYLARTATVIQSSRKVCDHYMKLAANSGDVASQMEYAAMLESGKFIQQNLKSAAKYYHSAAMKNDKNAQYIYGTFLEEGKGVSKNIFEAVEFYKKSADQGHSRAQLKLALLLKNEESAKYLKKAADANNTTAQVAYAKMLLAGEVVEKDVHAGMRYLKEAINLNNSDAMFILGCLLYYSSEKKKEDEGCHFIKKSASLGNGRAIFQCGLMISNLDSTIENISEIFFEDIIKNTSIENNNKALFENCWDNNLPEGENLDEIMEDCIQFFIRAAEDGLSDAQYLLGLLLLKNTYNKPLPHTPTDYIKKAADSGCTRAQLAHAVSMDDGRGIPQNLREAAKYYKMAADGGNVPAMVNYAFMLFDGRGPNRNRKEAIKYMKQAADANYLVAAFKYAMILYNGQGTSKDIKLAVSYFEKVVFGSANLTSSDIRHASDISNLQMMQESARSIRSAAEQGSSEAQRIYATMLLRGIIFQENPTEAQRYFKKAADSNDPVALCFVANQMLSSGNGDHIEAARKLKIAADLGNQYAQFKYAMMAEDGDGVEQNFVEAAEYYKKAADQNLPPAQLQYGIMLECGDGVEQNYEEAVKYYELAATTEPEAMINLGKMLKNGIGIEKNLERAASLFQKAAKMGNKDGQYMYARMLQKGEGVKCDKRTAAYLYKMAASPPFMSKASYTPKAQFRYAEMLEKGDGILMDFEEATKFFNYASDFDEPPEMVELKSFQTKTKQVKWTVFFLAFVLIAFEKFF